MRRVVRRHLILLLLLRTGFSAAVANAQQAADASAGYVPPEYIRNPPILPPHLRSRGPRSIALREATQLVLQRNLGLAFAREDVRIADAVSAGSLGRFEPTLQLSLGRDKSQSPPQTAQEGQEGQVLLNTRDAWGGRVFSVLPSGTQLSLDWSNVRTDSTLGAAVAPRLFRSTLMFAVTQPILRGFSFSAQVQLAPVLKAQFDSEAARQSARLRAMATLKSTEDAYWTLVERWKIYEVNRGTADLAEKQLQLTRRRIDAGVQPESELISAESTLAQRQLAVVVSESQIEEAADALRQLLNMPAGEWEQPLVPLDAPSFVPLSVPFASAMERALLSRPELKQVELDLRKTNVDLAVARNARLPQLNLGSSIGLVGQDVDYLQALDQLGGRSNWQWHVGMDFSWEPLGVATRAEIRRQQSVLREKGINRDQMLITIRLDVRAALRAIDTAQRQLIASARYRELAERSLDVEARRFMNGLSENLKVAQRQDYVAQARLAEVSALIQYEKARTFLQTAMGEILEARQLHFEVRGG